MLSLPHTAALGGAGTFVVPPFGSSPHVISISAAELKAGRPLPDTARRAAGLLNELGFVAFTTESAESGLVPKCLVERAAAAAATELDDMLARVAAVGIEPSDDSFSFAEVVHRSRRRYDLRLDLRRTPPTAPWEALGHAAAAWSTPVLAAAGIDELEPAVHGLITSLPGAANQRFHSDGARGSYNVIVPLVDTAEARIGTEFWPRSHEDLSAAAEAQALLEQPAEAAEAAVQASRREVVQPRLRAGELLLYDYRVIHRGPANAGPSSRAIFYGAWASAASAGDGCVEPTPRSHRGTTVGDGARGAAVADLLSLGCAGTTFRAVRSMSSSSGIDSLGSAAAPWEAGPRLPPPVAPSAPREPHSLYTVSSNTVSPRARTCVAGSVACRATAPRSTLARRRRSHRPTTRRASSRRLSTVAAPVVSSRCSLCARARRSPCHWGSKRRDGSP